MAEKGHPFTNNGTGDGTSGGYTAAEWRKRFRFLFGDGVTLEGNKLAVTGAASPLSVNTGHAVVDGLFYDNTASVSLTVTTPSVGTTGGHVILRADYAGQTVRAVAVRNTDGNSAIPALTQTSETTYEIRLASFTITTGGVITLTDTRSFLHPNTMVATANVDDGAITSAKILDGTIATGDIANDAVDDTKAGNRVLRLDRRQGGSATDWFADGTSNFTPTTTRRQVGARSGSTSLAAGASTTYTVTFPTAFSQNPLVMVCPAAAQDIIVAVSAVTTTTATIYVKNAGSGTLGTQWFNWSAEGQE